MIIKYQKKKKINLNIFYERKCKRKKTEVKGKYLIVEKFLEKNIHISL